MELCGIYTLKQLGWEGTVNWMAYTTFPGTFTQFTSKVGGSLVNASYSLDTLKYANGLFFEFLTEWQRDSTLVRRIWERMSLGGASYPKSHINVVLSQPPHSSSLDEGLKQYAIWRNFVLEDADSYHFKDAASYNTRPPVLRLTAPFSENNYSSPSASRPSGPGGTRYWSIRAARATLTVFFDGSNNKKWAAMLVGMQLADSSKVYEIPLTSPENTGSITVPIAGVDSFMLIPVVLDTTNALQQTFAASGIVETRATVTFINAIRSSNVGGSFLLDNIDTVSSGQTRFLVPGSNHIVRTLNLEFNADSVYKHHDWKNTPSKFRASDTFQVTNSFAQIANFIGLNYINIASELLPGSGKWGQLQFRDPWKVDANGNQPDQYDSLPFSIFFATSVFLDQDPNPLIPSVPYYRVRAPLTQTVGNLPATNPITCVFDHWEATGADLVTVASDSLSGYSTRAVIFRSSGAFVKAVYAISVPAAGKWNMLSVPATLADFTGRTVYAGTNQPVWSYRRFPNGQGGYSGSYVDKTDTLLSIGEGYWVKYPSATSVKYYGAPVTSTTMNVYPGWNLLGSLSGHVGFNNMTTSPGNIRTSAFFKYVNGGYVPVDTLATVNPHTIEPGYGYWAKFSTLGTLTYNTSFSGGSTTQPPPGNPPLSMGVPQLLSPDSGSIDRGVSLPLSWYSFGGALSYWVQVSTVSNFATTVVNDGNVTSNTKSVSGLSYSTTYYWRVIAFGNDASSTGWSNIWSFRTIAPPPVPPAPTLISPLHQATNVIVSPYLSWNASAGAASYRLQVSLNSAFSQLLYDISNIAGTSRQIGPLNYGTIYHWRVNATNVGGTSGWSHQRYFTTEAAPPPDPCPTNATYASMDQLTVSDADGNGQTLYMRNGKFLLGASLNPDDEMPPAPPEVSGIFHARFHSGKFLETIKPGNGKKTLPLKLQNARLPLTVSWNTKQENRMNLWLHKPGNGNGNGQLTEVLMEGVGQTTIDSLSEEMAKGKSLFIVAQSSAPDPCEATRAERGHIPSEEMHQSNSTKPTRFHLAQNRPNPFNPMTMIRYEIPDPGGLVRLIVYDVLGREITRLVDQERTVGVYETRWDGSTAAGGVYYIRMTVIGDAGEIRYQEMRKMVLVK